METAKLLVSNVSKTFYTTKNTIEAVRTASIEVKDGEFISLIGPSGCGKSTILDIAAGLTNPDEGTVSLNGTDITNQKGHVSYMPQSDVLFPWRTILDNVIVPLEVAGVNKKEAREQAQSLLTLFGLESFADSYPHTLSGGMRQRAAFLRTHLCHKEVMLLDEPFGKLDALTRRQLQQWLLSIWQQFQRSVVLVTHDVDEALLLSDRIYVMSSRPGQIIYELTVDLPRPRDPEVMTTQTFNEMKRTLFQHLQEANSPVS
ncbi:ABC transporter ATP-binding protein [Bacillus sp. Hm123]|uniref:ABC transporter ATP-binding protein n=1 Tax=Bacillus sp. Hm123 TaxID=3450745 RepID=UPI003F43D2BD